MCRINFRRCDKFEPDLVWDVLCKVVQSNARIDLTDHLEVHLDHIRMPVDNGKTAEKTKGRLVHVLSAIQKIIVFMKAALLCLAHSLIIATARFHGDSKYPSYRDSGVLKKVEEILKSSGVDLSKGGGFKELQQF